MIHKWGVIKICIDDDGSNQPYEDYEQLGGVQKLNNLEMPLKRAVN